MTQKKFLTIYNTVTTINITNSLLKFWSILTLIITQLLLIKSNHIFAINAELAILLIIALSSGALKSLTLHITQTIYATTFVLKITTGFILSLLLLSIPSTEKLQLLFIIAVVAFIALKLADALSDYLWQKYVINKIYKKQISDNFYQILTAIESSDLNTITNLVIEDNYQNIVFISKAEHLKHTTTYGNYEEITLTTRAKRTNDNEITIAKYTITPLIPKAKKALD
jgi:hypothetical protein